MAENTRKRLPGHPNTPALLAYLNMHGNPDEGSHIAHCAHCQAELEHIQCIRQTLQELPLQQPTADLWQNIQQQIFQHPQQRSFFSSQRMSWLAMAASLLLVAVVVLIQSRDDLTNPALAVLIEENQQLEAALVQLENQPSVMRLDAIGQITLLKDSVSALDMAFGRQFDKHDSNNTKVDLLEKRIRLMRELVEKRAQPMLAYSGEYRTF